MKKMASWFKSQRALQGFTGLICALDILKTFVRAHWVLVNTSGVLCFFKINLFIYGCVGSSLLHAGFLQLWQVGPLFLWCTGFSCCGVQAPGVWASAAVARGSVVVARGLQSAGSVVVACGLSCSAACGIFPGQGSNPCPLHWQADS